MKKFLCMLMALCMMAAVALADNSISWEQIVPVLEASSVSGQFYTFDEIAIKIWLPDGINPVELSEEDKANGYIGYFMPEDQSCSVSVVYVDVQGMSLEDYAAQLSGYGATEVEVGTVNNLPCITYKMPEQDSGHVTFTTEAGYGLEVSCWPLSQENADLVWGAVIGSIQNAD